MDQKPCKSISCPMVLPADHEEDFCAVCRGSAIARSTEMSMSQRYPKYYKNVVGLDEIDVYAVHQLFDIQDPSGAIQHASKKLLLSGVRTGGKSAVDDIREARDTLTRWLEINKTILPQ